MNVHLCFVRRSAEFRTTGAVQLFTSPHPVRKPKGEQLNEEKSFDQRYLPVYANENLPSNKQISTLESGDAFNLSQLLERIYELHVSSYLFDCRKNIDILESRRRIC